MGAEEREKLSRVLALAEDQGLVSSTCMASPRGLGIFFCSMHGV